MIHMMMSKTIMTISEDDGDHDDDEEWSLLSN